jgi:hypothetical protein
VRGVAGAHPFEKQISTYTGEFISVIEAILQYQLSGLEQLWVLGRRAVHYHRHKELGLRFEASNVREHGSHELAYSGCSGSRCMTGQEANGADQRRQGVSTVFRSPEWNDLTGHHRLVVPGMLRGCVSLCIPEEVPLLGSCWVCASKKGSI